jgi:LysR family transcriptional regulator, low CO2-responsive transcriptional regulator
VLDLDAVHAFIVFAEKRNFTHAAEELAISQPALHVKIRKLAEFLRLPLYRRNGRSLELTPAGIEVARYGRELRGNVDEFLAKLRGESVVEPVVLAAGEGSLLYLLADAIRAYVDHAPASLRLLTRTREGTLEAIRNGEAQLGVATLDVLPTDLIATPLLRAPQVVVMPSRHRLTRKRELEPRDLAGAPLIVPPAGRPHREAIGRALLDAGVSWTVAVEANGWPVMLAFAQSGIGLAIVNSTCTLPKGLTSRPLRGLPATHYHLVHRRGRLSEPASRLTTLIRETATRR